MHKQLKFGSFLLFIFICFTLSGCAVFSGGKVPETVLMPMEKTDQKRPTISYDITASSGVFSTSKSTEFIQNIFAGELLQTLEDSEYFSRISKNDDEAEINLSVTIKNSGNPVALIPAMLTGFSLYIIPSWATDKYIVTAVAKNMDGNSKQYVLEDTTTLVQWLPMIFAFPVKNFSVIPEVRKNMYRNIIMQMKNDGLISNNATVKISTSNR